MSLSGPGARRGRRGRQVFADINITPLTDVVLVLLIIFMVTAQFIAKSESGMDLKLPSATEVTSLDELDGIRVSVDRVGNLAVDGKPVSPEALETELRAAMTDPQQLVIVEGDRDTVLQNVVTIMDAALAVGMPNVVLATAADEPTTTPPSDLVVAPGPAPVEVIPAAPE